MEINSEIIRSLGMAIVHSLWEGVIIFLVVWVSLSFAGRKNARSRYGILIAGQGLLITAFFLTWHFMYHKNLVKMPEAGTLNALSARWQGIVSAPSLPLHAKNYSTIIQQWMEPMYPSIAMAWLLGFIFMAVRMAGGIYLSYNKARKELFIADKRLQALFDNIKSRLQMPVELSLKLSSRLVSPMVIGILKPCVIVPAAIISGLNTAQIEAILVHELAHIRRFDHIVIIIQAIITRILFFHPVAWFLSSEINKERENCCDDLVVTTFEDPINYIKALTMIQEMNIEGYVPANALLGRSKSLLHRIRRILKTDKNHTPVFRFTALFMLLAVAGIATITVMSAGKSETPINSEAVFMPVKEKPAVIFQDTSRKTKHAESYRTKKEPDSKELEKKEKELEQATRKLEKARLEMIWAQREVERAREEMVKAGGRMRSHDLAEFSMDMQKARMDKQMQMFKLRDQDMKNHMDRFKIHNEEMKQRMDIFRQQDWEKMNKEDWEKMNRDWQRSGEEMERRMEEFKIRHADSMFMRKHPQSFMKHPVPPIPPVDVDVESIPEPESPVPPADATEELLNEDSNANQDMDIKLKELEEK